MKQFPIIIFTTDRNYILKSKEIVSAFTSFLKINGYEYYYPFIEDMTTEKIDTQIDRDIARYKLEEVKEKLKALWKSLQSGLQKIETETELWSGKTFTCVITMYGPRGYYHTSSTVYINISFDSEREWIQTMLHEILHLVYFKQAEKMTHVEKERFIDEKFIEFWSDVFPEYAKQDILSKGNLDQC